MKKSAIILGGLMLLLLAAMMVKGSLLALPDAPASVAGGEFDTKRALARLQRILGDQRPHPVDSAANDAVRDRLIAELKAVGLEPRLTDDFACNGSAKERNIACARVRNVVATIGPAEGRHVLLVSHYDSTPVGPGASDDGIGMAAMIEIAALLRSQRLQRPVSFLFNEGEEPGLIGARAFLDRDPLASQVEALINLESRGVTGPAIMFETSRPNGSAVTAYARSASRPVANSMTTDFYRLIPNSTDVAVFEESDWTILNFAVIGNETRYHAPGDDLAALDPRSVAHMGEQALAAARLLANGEAGATGNRLYADLLGRTMISFPATPGFILLALLLLALVWMAFLRRGGLRRAAAAIGLALFGSALFAFAAQALVGVIRAGAWWRAFPEAAGVGIYGSALAVSLLAALSLARPIARDRLRTAFWLIFLLLGALISVIAPGATIFFLAPPLVAVLGMAAERRLPGTERIAALIAWALLFLTWAPLLHLTEILLDMDAAWIFAPVAALILFPALIELKPLAVRLPGRALAVALAAAALLAWLPALLAPAYSDDRKREFGIEYAWHATDRKAQWLIAHDGGDLPAAFAAPGRLEHGVEVPWSSRPRSVAPAPAIPIEAPSLDNLGVRKAGASRIVSLRLHPNGAETVRLRLEPEARLIGVKAGGWERRFGAGKADEDFLFRCHGRACDGLIFDLEIAEPQRVEALLIGVRDGLPAAGAPLVAARPSDAAPQYSPDSTIAIRRIRL
jgi:hypothetical protein